MHAVPDFLMHVDVLMSVDSDSFGSALQTQLDAMRKRIDGNAAVPGDFSSRDRRLIATVWQTRALGKIVDIHRGEPNSASFSGFRDGMATVIASPYVGDGAGTLPDHASPKEIEPGAYDHFLRHELQHLMDEVKGGPRSRMRSDKFFAGDPEERAHVLRQEFAANYASAQSPEDAVALTRARYHDFTVAIDELRTTEVQRRGQLKADRGTDVSWSVDRQIWWDVIRGRVRSLP
jgi:hypothetical protein